MPILVTDSGFILRNLKHMCFAIYTNQISLVFLYKMHFVCIIIVFSLTQKHTFSCLHMSRSMHLLHLHPCPCELVFCHLDIAPRNLLRQEDGSLCLIDWASAGYYPRLFEFGMQWIGRRNDKVIDRSLMPMKVGYLTGIYIVNLNMYS